MGFKSFIGELRRRHVFRVAAWYAVAAWLVIQIAVNVFPHLLLPDWSVRLVIVLCLIGFPIAIAMAWSLEITPEGLEVAEERERKVPRPSSSPLRSTSMWLALAGGILLGAGAVQAWRTLTLPSAEGAPARVVAVLPFENLGGDDANAAFTAGIHDSLITRIAKIGGMTVISRTSVMAYEGKRPNLKDVAKALGVTHVVEGSVQRAGEQVRIQAQLIDAATDAHLWAESYDRMLAEGFATQNEIATAIAQELSVRISDQERAVLQSVPTQNAKAFEQYVLGHSEIVRDDISKAIAHLRAAVELDPHFALAIAELSMAQSARAATYSASIEEKYEEYLAAARESYERALTLQPELPEGKLARGMYQFRGKENIVAAEPDLSAAIMQLPNNHLAHSYLGQLRTRQARWDEASGLLERAATIEPGDLETLYALYNTYSALRRRQSLELAIRRTRAGNPERMEVSLSYVRSIFDGDLAGYVVALERWLARHPADEDASLSLWFCYMPQGRFQEAARVLESLPGEHGEIPGHRAKLIGWAYRLAGDQATANRWFETSLAQFDRSGPPKRRAELATYLELRGYVLAGLGRNDEAAVSLRQLLALTPRSEDELEWAARAYDGFALLGQLGDMPGALALVRQLLDPPTAIMPYDIWLNSFAAPLRTNPEFRELMARHGVDVTRDPRAEYAAKQAAVTSR